MMAEFEASYDKAHGEPRDEAAIKRRQNAIERDVIAALNKEADAARKFSILTHGSTRGKNEMAEFRIIAVHGRLLTSPGDRAATVSILTGRPVLPGETELVAAAWQMTDGSGQPGFRWADSAGGLADDLARGAEDSVTQADARVRGVRRTAGRPTTNFLNVDGVVEGLPVDSVQGAAREPVQLGEESLVQDLLGVAVGEMGLVPFGTKGGRVWRTTFDYTAKEWEHARSRFEAWPVAPHSLSYTKTEEGDGDPNNIENGGLQATSLGIRLDMIASAAKLAARADDNLKVIRIETAHGPANVIALTEAAQTVVARLGMPWSILTGRDRTRALREHV
jgi:hypothetical protein